MKFQFNKNRIAACVLAVMSMGVHANEEQKGIAEGISSTVDVSFRYRIETVDQEGSLEKAEASTLKTRATVKTSWSSQFDTLIEFDNVSVVGWDDYNAGAGNTPDTTNHAVVADPEGTDLNQAFVRYRGDNTSVAYGRQRILIGNQRFVGGVGWRQNEQTYDSLTLNSEFAEDFKLSFAHVFNVNRIFGDDVDGGDHRHDTNLVNLDYKGLGNGTLSAYYFQIDNEAAAGLSNDTFGVRYSGKAGNFAYAVEYASQSDGGNNPNDYDADYFLLDAKYQQKNYAFGAGLEVLGGDTAGGQGFTTSLATLHKFQGWADVFLGTPVAGIEDLYINGSFKVNGFNFKAIYHDFSTDEGGVDLGTEIDFVVSKKINKNLSAMFKYADFSSDNAAYASREKVWVMLTYKP
ncbi:alginate export family protein [Aliikangiella coralliicola]|uniref:Alginate export domain-containing protein n=1 Tax=Aliikangiella coralliicola TaxID=2592383 RepID=A0A545UDI0_9GAMM|nr:alginate export family protein [Aliikangiella coralliicola]TQV87526.1 hypothetical protein FLL46_11675 [Aliikangiella coralliicola]